MKSMKRARLARALFILEGIELMRERGRRMNDSPNQMPAPKRRYNIPCLVCARELQVVGVGDHNFVGVVEGDDGGVVAHILGNYGSSLFDTLGRSDHEYLRAAICDRCLRSRSSRLQHIFWEKPIANVDKVLPFTDDLERFNSPTRIALENLASESEFE